MTKELYHKLRSEGVKGLELGVQNTVLVRAFGSKTKCIRMQAMLPIHIDNIVVDHIFLISPQLLTQALLGVDFCRMNNVIINFLEQCFTVKRDGKVSRHHFAYNNNARPTSTSNPSSVDCNKKTEIKSEQGAANLKTNRATGDYTNHKL
jgi:hypothetical protein